MYFLPELIKIEGEMIKCGGEKFLGVRCVP